jgi:hypothetical protein
VPVNSWQTDRRQPLGNITEKLYATRAQRKRRSSDDTANDYEERYRFVFQENLSQNEHSQSDSSDKQ